MCYRSFRWSTEASVEDRTGPDCCRLLGAIFLVPDFICFGATGDFCTVEDVGRFQASSQACSSILRSGSSLESRSS
ncbi:hypothetical protein L3Y34_011268 [Caenorhabditis briggsae]|uniref:Uncharacterized protein n=1 Tax=Caenorhabditis briggsae TaxID=6238 RepID=A0AAE9CU86_CAEBR|nr:hypothetical protein L3Y34_011268 [Caenorhabditis briggsae]